MAKIGTLCPLLRDIAQDGQAFSTKNAKNMVV
jgi:hypothetical protein